MKFKDDSDLFFNEPWELCRIAKNYFHNVFSPSSGDYDPVLKVMNTKILAEDNDSLLVPFTKVEFYQALKQMHPDKAQGPDGFGSAFYQKFWELTGDDIFREGVSWLEQGMFSYGLNDANIVLIPKCKDPSTMNDLANRLKGVLPKVISETQFAFIKGRSITDNVMIAFELLHYMKRNTTKKRGEVAFKIDISKAYDHVDWGYMRLLMLKLGFDQRWVNIVMMCLSTVRYSVLVNDQKVGAITPGRGLR